MRKNKNSNRYSVNVDSNSYVAAIGNLMAAAESVPEEERPAVLSRVHLVSAPAIEKTKRGIKLKPSRDMLELVGDLIGRQ